MTTLRDMLTNANAPDKLPHYVPKDEPKSWESPKPDPANLRDEVVQSFIKMGKDIARALREAGKFAYEQGVKRQEEYEKAALAAEAKGEFQAREAGELINDFQTLRNVAINKNPAPMPPYTTTQVAEEEKQK